MEVYSASDAKREFGELLLKSQSGPVSVTRNGKPVAVLLSSDEYERLLSAKREQLTYAIKEGVADYRAGNVSSSDSASTHE
ncbi:prevent-host-death family protein [Alteromonadaceae bacterium 2753L.S.0a.02]|nr:prevent-host-death family protein [Alteromonadaceae bacterium 2753L.S.0a.02]